MKPQVEIIWTFENSPQQMGSAFVTPQQFDNKKEFFKTVTSCLDDDEKATLVKISCAVKGISIPSPDHWYLKCNGKFWDDEIPQLILDTWQIESIITPVNV